MNVLQGKQPRKFVLDAELLNAHLSTAVVNICTGSASNLASARPAFAAAVRPEINFCIPQEILTSAPLWWKQRSYCTAQACKSQADMAAKPVSTHNNQLCCIIWQVAALEEAGL